MCLSVIGYFFIDIGVLLRPQSCHPLDPLSPAEIVVAIATVRAAGATPEVSEDSKVRKKNHWPQC